MPAYRADFYIPENIIGYTGRLHDNPTVYFHDAGEFGHITQAYPDAWNIGREGVDSVPAAGWTYHIENRVRNGAEKAYEFCRGPNGEVLPVLHTSRNTFTDTRRANIDTFAILAQAIWRFTDRKAGQPRGNIMARTSFG